MIEAKSTYTRAILKAQRTYIAQISQGDTTADAVREEHDLLLRLAEEGFRYPELWQATADFVHIVFGAVERWGEWAQWQILLETAVTHLHDQPHAFIKITHWLGHIYFLHRNFADALLVLKDAQAIATQSTPSFNAQIQQRLCNVYLALGDLQAAQAAADKGLALCQQTAGEDALTAAIWNSAGLVAMQQNAYDEAIESFNTAVLLWQKQNRLTPLSRCELNLGVAYFQLGQLNNATVHFKSALEHLEALNSPVDKLRAVNNLASCYYMQEAYAEGEQVLRQAIAESRPLAGIYHVRASLNHNLGNTLLALKRYGEAQVYLHNSLHLWEMANDDLEKANTHDTLAELFQKQGSFAQAIEHYKEAHRLAKQHPGNAFAENLVSHCKTEMIKCAAQLES